MKLIIATTNSGKLKEVSSYLKNDTIQILSLADFPEIGDIVEDGSTFTENALIKARTVSIITGLQALADDSGLMVDALNGAPGVLSARFAPTTEERNAKLLDKLRKVPESERTARFVCAMAFVRPDGFEWTAEGSVEGMITLEASGNAGFGYDPVFYYPQLQATFADISKEEKNSISHRGNALRQFMAAVTDNSILT